MEFKPFLGYMLFVTIRISLMLDLIETEKVEHENLKCMGIMQDDLVLPYLVITC